MTQLALFRGPQARAVDPPTSADAAASMPPCGALEGLILAQFDDGGLTDDELCERLADNDLYPPTVKTCRSRLAKRGLLIPTPERRPSWRNRDQIVWAKP